jgi:hypothetical protein
MLRAQLATIAAAALLTAAVPAQGAIRVYTGVMSGATENPPNASTASGFTRVTVDDVLNTMLVDVDWTGLTGGLPAAAHIHCCAPLGTNVGVAVGFPGFPSTLSGNYSHLFNLTDSSIYTAGFLSTFGSGTAAGAEAALLQGMASGLAYSNIHNAVFAGGEIRAQLAAVPEPQTWALMLAGFGLLGASLRRRRSPAVSYGRA